MAASVVQTLSGVEASALSTWLRESTTIFAFPSVLILHTWGLAFLVGSSLAIVLRVLGVAPGVSPGALDRYARVMWIGFWINAASGVLLLVAYPTKALTNPLFYAKLALIATALALMRPIRRAARDGEAAGAQASGVRGLAAMCLAAWVGAIFAGRFLAYTYTYLFAYDLTR